MANNPKVCPYFEAINQHKVMCKGMEPGINICQGFTSPAEKKPQYELFCGAAYHRCGIASMLNDRYHKFEASSCPNNRMVECLHTDDCSRCGWNPDVKKKRLAAIAEKANVE